MEHQNNVWNLFKVNSKNANDVIDVVMVFSLLTLNKFYIIFWCLYNWLWTGKHRLGIDIFKFYVNLSRRTCMVFLKFSTWFFLHQKNFLLFLFFLTKNRCFVYLSFISRCLLENATITLRFTDYFLRLL